MSDITRATENEPAPQNQKGRWGKFGLGISILSQVVLLCAIVSFFSSFQFMEGMFVPILFVSLPLAVIAIFLIIIGLVLCLVGLFTQDGSRKTSLIGLGVLSLTFVFVLIAYLRLNP